MKSACVGVLSIIELKNARRNIEIGKKKFIIFNSQPNLTQLWDTPDFSLCFSWIVKR